MKKRKVSRQKQPVARILFSQGEGADFSAQNSLEKIFRNFLEVFPQKPALVECRFVRSAEMQQLNRQYRKKNKATDVLSFSSSQPTSLLGSIIIDLDTAAEQAQFYRHSLKQEVEELFIHGLLHLAGMDHENFAEAQLMKSYEKSLFKKGGSQ